MSSEALPPCQTPNADINFCISLTFSHSLELLEGLPATSHVLLPALELVQLPDTTPTPGGIDVSHRSKGRLHSARHLFQEHIKVGHFLLVDDNAAPREERVPVAIHQHALHARLREPRRLGARTGHAAGSVRPAQPQPPAPVCSGELRPGNPSGPDTAHAGHTGTPPGSDRGPPGPGTAPRSLYTAAPPRQPARCSGRRGSRVWETPSQAEHSGRHSRDTNCRGPQRRGTSSSGSAMTGSPAALLSSGNLTPRVLDLPAGQPAGSQPGPEPPGKEGEGRHA